MIAYIEKLPSIERRGDGFLLTFASGDTETRMFLTLHAMTGLCGKGMGFVKAAQTEAALFEPTPFKPKQRRR